MICQPRRPSQPFSDSSAVDIGAPAAMAIGRPTRKAGNDPGVVVVRKPIGEVQDQAREEPGLRKA